ncbi:MAG TPA: GGDEF domain-containing protein [Terracidiphilus sp.]|nr:GGDEF domain-containing protein [Terracidiphilus sp.]
MKNFLIPVLIAFGCTSIAGGSNLAPLPPAPLPPVPLTTLRAAAALTNTQASEHMPVSFEATVIYHSRKRKTIDVQDDGTAINVELASDANVVPGDRVLVHGITQPSFLPIIIGASVTLLRHGALPAPVPATFDDLVRTRLNCRLVKVRGIIRTLDLPASSVNSISHLQLLMEGGYIDIELEDQDASALQAKDLLDAEVEVTGVAGRIFDGKLRQTGAKIKVSSIADIEVTKHASANPWTLPVTPLSDVITGVHVNDLTQRLRVHGTITYYQPGNAVVLQNGATSLWIATRTSDPLRVGDIADATGFPEVHDGRLTLVHAEIRDSLEQAPIEPQSATWHQLAFWGSNVIGGHQYDLVSVKGRVAAQLREDMRDEYVLVADGQEFTAIYAHPFSQGNLQPMLQVPLDSTVQVTGICVPQDAQPLNGQSSFDILLRSPADLAILATPSWFTVHHLSAVAIVLLLLILAVGARAWYIDRAMRAQVAGLAYIEQRRGLILEDINKSRPLASILEGITELVSVGIKGAPCWCQIADGARLGNCPSNPSAPELRIVEQAIAAHSGPQLGSIFAAFDARTPPRPEEVRALVAAAELATLAIETSHLHTDLVHRSEFDMLTELQNRFSFEKHLDSFIREARQTAGIFGLIFMDLDQFKQVNDVYGHHIGDLYLQQAAARMKAQLRPGDMLARVGGDEFASLVPVAHNRSDVGEIASRLEHCFDEPFIVQDHVLHGSASIGIALYPEDAVNNDALLNAADAAMYRAKNSKKAQVEMDALVAHPDLTSQIRE